MNKVDILIACDLNKSRPWYRDRIPSIKNAIENGNYNIKLIDIYDSLGEFKYMPTNTNQRKYFLQNENLLLANKKFEDEIIKISPRVLLLGTADNYKEFLIPKTLKNIRSKGVFVSGILGDDEFNYESHKFLLGWFDLFVAYVKPCVKYYESFDISKGYFLPNSCYLNETKFESLSQETEYEIILMGSPFANRPLIVKSLIENGLKVGIFGSKKWLRHKFAQKSYHGYVETEKFDQVLAKGKIVLALLEDHISGNLHMNTKIWEAVRVGRLPICTYYEPLFNDYGLTEGVDIVTYRNIDELVSKAKYYIQNEKERTKIIENLYLKVQTEFDYSILYLNLFEKIIQLKKVNNFKPTVNNINSLFSKSQSNKIDNEIYNILSIIEKDKTNDYNYIYFNSIENGKRVISRWPFISFSNIIFLKKSKTTIGNFVTMISTLNKKKFLHVNQFLIIKDNLTLIGRFNRVIDKIVHLIIKNH